jgi:hypothetical protein
MNFVITFFLFLILSISSFVLGNTVFYEKLEYLSSSQSNLYYAAMVVGTIFLAATVITFLAALFQNMILHRNIKHNFNKIREHQKDKKTYEAQMAQYKKEVENSLTKLYPDYEKEIFNAINPNDAEHLSALMMKYPELKFNGVLETYTGKIAAFVKSINGRDREINEEIREMEDTETCGWMLGSVKKPQFVLDLVKES